jgi:hypothetical protein
MSADTHQKEIDARKRNLSRGPALATTANIQVTSTDQLLSIFGNLHGRHPRHYDKALLCLHQASHWSLDLRPGSVSAHVKRVCPVTNGSGSATMNTLAPHALLTDTHVSTLQKVDLPLSSSTAKMQSGIAQQRLSVG